MPHFFAKLTALDVMSVLAARPFQKPTFLKKLILGLCILVTATIVRAQEVSCGLNSNEASVGEPVQLIVTVRGAPRAEVPQSIPVDGLRINLAGRSSQYEMNNFKLTSTLTYTYIVVPQFDGEFTIPPFDVRIDKKVFRTEAIRLSAHGGARPPAPTLPSPGQQSPQPPPSARRSANAQPYFAELLLTKKKAYVGEIIPAELRFYFNSRYGGQVSERPTFSGEGFTVQKFPSAQKREQVIEGENYVVFVFKTAVTPVKSGMLQIPAARLDARLQLPGNAPQGLSEFFNNFGGAIPPGMFTDNREVAIETKPAQIEVSALPKEGRPEDFSGAVGKFTMEATVSPKKATAGEPVTLRAIIAGQGNLEALGAPTLTEDEGWRSYPPSDKLQSVDATGFAGEKAFEFPIIARQDQTQTPGLSFSYFDPAAVKYVTLTQAPLPVNAKAGTPAATAAAPAAGTKPPAPAATPPPAAKQIDISMMAGGSKSWSSLLLRKGFLAVNGAVAAFWLGLLTTYAVKGFATSATGRQLARQKKIKELLSSVRHSGPETFYELAAGFLCTRVGTEGDAFAAAERINASPLPDSLKTSLQAVFERYGESKFAAGSKILPAVDERSDVLAALSEFNSKYEK